MKLGPFTLASYARCSMWDMDFVTFGFVVSLTRYVDELKNKRTPSNDAAPPWKEIPTDDIFKD